MPFQRTITSLLTDSLVENKGGLVYHDNMWLQTILGPSYQPTIIQAVTQAGQIMANQKGLPLTISSYSFNKPRWQEYLTNGTLSDPQVKTQYISLEKAARARHLALHRGVGVINVDITRDRDRKTFQVLLDAIAEAEVICAAQWQIQFLGFDPSAISWHVAQKFGCINTSSIEKNLLNCLPYDPPKRVIFFQPNHFKTKIKTPILGTVKVWETKVKF